MYRIILAHHNETSIKLICDMKIAWFFRACINGFNLSSLFYERRSRCIDKSFIIKEITLLPSLYEIGIQFLIVSGWYMSLCKHIQCNISPEMISYKDIFNRILLILHLQTQWKRRMIYGYCALRCSILFILNHISFLLLMYHFKYIPKFETSRSPSLIRNCMNLYFWLA